MHMKGSFTGYVNSNLHRDRNDYLHKNKFSWRPFVSLTKKDVGNDTDSI
jgi:hypothetical protein